MCGVFGVALPPGSGAEAAAVASTGLFALQHRGQESAGLAVSDGAEIFLYKDLGMIAQVLDDRRLPSFHGDLAIAHCRYSTTGSTIWENAQPTFRLGPRRAVAIGHNGNLVNTRELLTQLEGGRARLAATTDTELLTTLLADEPATDTVEALLQLLPRVRGAFTLVVLDKGRIIGMRDPHGFRPLVLGRIPEIATATDAALWATEGTRDGWVLSSETTGLDIIGAEFVRDVEPGEMIILESGREPR
ncbi:MAG: class II glutamine amidotransferase, partial [Candidatus Limnocylindrales bacterium]